ncbi:MAG: hypothetical protein ACTSR7_15920 [Promethearchaeota archaeon]
MQENLIMNENLEEVKKDLITVQHFFEKVTSNIQNTNFLLKKDSILLFYLGALINDTIYKQQRFFNTRGLIKKINPFLNFIGPIQITSIVNLCNSIQLKISKKEKIKTSFLREIINKLLSEIQKKDFESSQDDLIATFSMGYSIYSKCWNFVFEKVNINQITFSSIVLEIIKKKEEQKDLEDIFRKSYIHNNDSFMLGFFVGSYFLTTALVQFKIMNTSSLIKHIPNFFKRINAKGIKIWMREITKVNFKISAHSKTNSNSMFLFSSNLIIVTHFLLSMKKIILNEAHFSLGFWLALTEFDLRMVKIKSRDQMDRLNEHESETNSEKKSEPWITFEEYESHIESYSESKPTSKLAFLTGIFLNRVNYYEDKLLSTKRLKKKIPLAMRHMDFGQLEKILKGIIYTYMLCWSKKKKQDQIFSILPRLRIKLFSVFGEIIENEASISDITIHFIKGYKCPRELSWKRNNK